MTALESNGLERLAGLQSRLETAVKETMGTGYYPDELGPAIGLDT